MTIRYIRAAAAAGTAMALSLAAPAGAQTTASLAVNASVPPACTIQNASIEFGNVNAFGLVAKTVVPDTPANVTVHCTNTTAYSLSANAGNTAGATTGDRKMTGGRGSDTLSYNLLKDNQAHIIWGDGTNNSHKILGTGTGSPVTHTIWGRVMFDQTPPPGSYSDLVLMTVTIE